MSSEHVVDVEAQDAQRKAVLLADAVITNAIHTMVRHVFGVHGLEVFKALRTPAMTTEMRFAIERAVEQAYEDGARIAHARAQVPIRNLRDALTQSIGQTAAAKCPPSE